MTYIGGQRTVTSDVTCDGPGRLFETAGRRTKIAIRAKIIALGYQKYRCVNDIN